MANLNIRSLADGERRDFAAHGHAVVTQAGATAALRGTFEPGWRWSQDVGPIAGTISCQVAHRGYVLSGAMTIRMDDGDEQTMRGGDLVDIGPGHDAWVVGDEPCEMLDMSPQGLQYAMPRPADIAAPEDSSMELVRKGYLAFDNGDADTLIDLFTSDVVVHVPGTGPLAGTYKGPEAVLGYYARLAELTEGTFKIHLLDLHGDGLGHVLALHRTTSERNGAKRIARGSILFTFVGTKVSDMLELHGDLPGDDAFMA